MESEHIEDSLKHIGIRVNGRFMITIQIRDEELAGKSLAEFSLDVLTEQITVRELIRSRVYQQVQDKNLAPSPVFGGIVAPIASDHLESSKLSMAFRSFFSMPLDTPTLTN